MRYIIDNNMDYSLRLRILLTPTTTAGTLLSWGNLTISVNTDLSFTVSTGVFSEIAYPDEAISWLDIVKSGTTYDIYINNEPVTTHTDAAVYSLFLTVESFYTIDTLTIWPEYIADQDDISENYENVLAEQLFCDYNKNTLIRSRCNITPYIIGGVNTTYIKEQGGTGTPQANKTNFVIKNKSGQFADDQYGNFDPESGNYNGTTDERYLRNRVGVETEVMVGDEVEPLFRGRTDSTRFAREEAAGKVNRISIAANDMAEALSCREVKTTRYYEGHYIASDDEDTSLFHKLATLALEHECSQLVHNSSFANGSTSWAIDGFSSYYSTGGIFSGYANIRYAIGQDIEDLTIRAGETYYIDIYCKHSNFGGTIRTYLDGVYQEQATFSASHSEVSRLRVVFKTTTYADKITLQIDNNGGEIYMELHGVQISRQNPVVYIENTDTDTPTEENITYQSYMPVGLNISQQLYQQGFTVIRTGSIWDYMKQMHIAGIGMYLGFSKGGVFTWKNYSDDFENLGQFPDYGKLRSISVSLTNEYNVLYVSGVEITKVSRGSRRLVFTSGDSAMDITEDVYDNSTTAVQDAIQAVYDQEEEVCDIIYEDESSPTEKLFGADYTVELSEVSE